MNRRGGNPQYTRSVVESRIGRAIVAGEAAEGAIIEAGVENGGLELTVKAPVAPVG